MEYKEIVKKVWMLAVLVLVVASASAQTIDDSQTFSQQYRAYMKAAKGSENDSMLAARAEKLIPASAQEFGPTHINTINMTISTANHYRNARQHDVAAKWYDHALGLFEQSDSKEPKGYMLLLSEILKLNINIGFRDKKSLTRDLKNALQDFFETTHPDETIVMSMEIYSTIILKGITQSGARSLRQLGDSIVAEAEARMAVGDFRLLKLQFNHAKLLKAVDRKDDAIAYFHKVIAGTDQQGNSTHPFALGAHAQLVGLYESKRDSESATEHCIAIGRMTPWRDDLDPVPLYRENPVYPVNYGRRNKEGWVLLEFDITPFGFVENVSVIASEGGEEFEREGLKALKNWRYAPKFQDGVTVKAADVQVRLNFILGKSEFELKNL